MARVREDAPSLPRRFVWTTAIASFVLCAAIAIAFMSRTPTSVISLPRAPQLAIAQSAVTGNVPVTITMETRSTRRVIPKSRGAIGVGSRMPLLPIDVSAIEPIQTEPILLSVIDVPGLEREATSIDILTIEPLTIEPLAASND
jgi:hypothetical protein